MYFPPFERLAWLCRLKILLEFIVTQVFATLASTAHLSRIQSYKVELHPPTCELAKRSKVDRFIMSSPTFRTFPREIRDRIYDFVWDLRQAVAPSGWSSMYMPYSLRRFNPFDSVPFHETLALLHVNHQISAEAVSTFYGKRKFSSNPDQLIPFLKEIAPHRHLIKAIEVFEDPVSPLRFPPQIFDFLQTLDALRSLAMRIETYCLRSLQEHLIEAGIHRVTERMVFTVHSYHEKTLTNWEEGMSKYSEEQVVFIKTLTCAKGGKELKSQGFRCRVVERYDVGRLEWRPVHVPSQPCNHYHHRTGRY